MPYISGKYNCLGASELSVNTVTDVPEKYQQLRCTRGSDDKLTVVYSTGELWFKICPEMFDRTNFPLIHSTGEGVYGIKILDMNTMVTFIFEFLNNGLIINISAPFDVPELQAVVRTDTVIRYAKSADTRRKPSISPGLC